MEGVMGRHDSLQIENTGVGVAFWVVTGLSYNLSCQDNRKAGH